MEHLSCRSSTMHVEIYPSKTSFLIHRTLYIFLRGVLCLFFRENLVRLYHQEREMLVYARENKRERKRK